MKNKKDFKLAREELRAWVSKWTRCEIQGGQSKKGKKLDFGWSCGTCFLALLDNIGLKPSASEYSEHNKPVERINEVWRAILQIRDAKL